MPIPAKRRPFFKASKELRELLNEAPESGADSRD
jgi:nucleoid DNA-binding protein